MIKTTSAATTIMKIGTRTAAVITAESVLLPLSANDVLSSAVVTSTAAAVIKKQNINGLYVDKNSKLEMWANAQRDGRPAEYRWRPLFNTAKFG